MNQRHQFLERFITVKDDEVISYENMNTCLLTVTVCFCVFSVLEVTCYFLYLNIVSIDLVSIPDSGPNETRGIGIKLTIFIKFHPWIKILRGKVIDQNTDDSSKDSVVKEEKKIGDNFYFCIY